MRRKLLIVVFVLILGALSISTAQTDNEESLEAGCPTMVQRALVELGNTCSGIGRNNACYGSGDVSATFTLDAQNPEFDIPGDEAQLTFIETLRTSPLMELAENESEWGIAVLNVIANLPDVLPGQAVTFLLMGDAELENAVSPDQARLPIEPVPVMTTIDANIRSHPDVTGAVIGSVASNTELLIDGMDSSGTWLRLLWADDTLAWISRTVILEDSTLDNVPIITDSRLSMSAPMQAFYLRTGIGQQNCAEAPNALVVQGREQFTVNLNINGADVQFGDTVVVQAVPEDDGDTSTKLPANQRAMQTDDDLSPTSRLRIISLGDDPVVINAGQDDEVVINNGQQTSTCLSAPQNLGIDGQANDQVIITDCGWTAPEDVSFEDTQAFEVLQDIPTDVTGGQTIPVPFAPPQNPEVDTDGDGILDGEDNCPFRPNQGQRDDDDDGRGNACDRDDDNDGFLDINDDCPLVAGDILGCVGNAVGDIDEDGIHNREDNCPYDPNPSQRDPDNDGRGIPCDEDNDGDGIPDDEDDCPVTPNTPNNPCIPEADDEDGDGIANEEDNCPFTSNSGQSDHDEDGIGSACDEDIDGDGFENQEDECPLIAGEFNGCPDESDDSDNDGVLDNVDNCPFTPNQAQNDFDEDGIGNPCDTDNDNDGFRDEEDECPLIAGEFNGCPDEDPDDSDNDGVSDNEDNCPTIFNPDQDDLDNDGAGDMCDDSDDDGFRDADDDCPFDGDRGYGVDANGCPNPPTTTDSDDDGFPDNIDNCPNVYNAGQSDIDNDGIGDACDNDMDGDGFPNGNDNCPQQAGTYNGCPDGDDDGDGVPNSVDVCPGGDDTRDQDGDGTPDDCDGDVDGDGFPNGGDQCPWQAGSFNGCPDGDDDGDGVLNSVDVCPGGDDTRDQDGDGTPDDCDDDVDGDGYPNGDDQCPFDPSANANGCP